MATCKQPALLVAMKFIWVLYRAGAAAAGAPCAVTVTQPRSLEAKAALSNVTIPCAFSTQGCEGHSPTVLWFRYLAHAHEDLCVPNCARSEKFQATAAPAPEKQASLRIIRASVGDSAIYFCGVAFANSDNPFSKQTGEGTALTIRESKYSTGVSVMAAVSVLLFIYLAALFAGFRVFSKPKETKRGGHNAEIKQGGQSISRAIAQELCRKKNKLHCRPKKHLEKENIYQNR